MAKHSLIELRHTRFEIGRTIAVEDYSTHPRLCRSGLWIGLASDLIETIVLSYEHDSGPDPEQLSVGWAINGFTVSEPGSPDSHPESVLGWPAPDASSVSYVTPVDGLHHRLQLRSTPGITGVCLNVQVLYRLPSEDPNSGSTPHPGPSRMTCLSGRDVAWPHDKLEAEQACWRRFRDLVERVIDVVPVGPGPVEEWLARATDDDLRFFHAGFETLEALHPERDAELGVALRAQMAATIKRLRTPRPSSPQQPQTDLLLAGRPEVDDLGGRLSHRYGGPCL